METPDLHIYCEYKAPLRDQGTPGHIYSEYGDPDPHIYHT